MTRESEDVNKKGAKKLEALSKVSLENTEIEQIKKSITENRSACAYLVLKVNRIFSIILSQTCEDGNFNSKMLQECAEVIKETTEIMENFYPDFLDEYFGKEEEDSENE